MALLFWAFAFLAPAAETKSIEPTRNGQAVQIGTPLYQDNVLNNNAIVGPGTLNAPNALPPTVQDRMLRFQKESKLYVEKQEALKKTLKGANDLERARIREELRELRQAWLDQARQVSSEAKGELKRAPPSYRELFDSMSKQPPQDGKRTRPGR